jgi:hypothetical protein
MTPHTSDIVSALTCTENIELSSWRESKEAVAVQKRSSSKKKVPKDLQTGCPFSPLTRTRKIIHLLAGVWSKDAFTHKLKGGNVVRIKERTAWKLTSADG